MGKKKRYSLAGSMEDTPCCYLRVSGLPGRKRARILIVDDQAPIRKALRKFLDEEKGWEVCGEAENGREAIDKSLQLKPDLITLDLSMPVMNGMEAARELRRAFPSVSLVMFTLHRTPHLEQQAYRAGVDAVVGKEDLEGLIACLVRMLESRSGLA
ncbi:MAG: response regulator transcription factor [Acidobacteria bacterium]|nr:MAG: response regulator transcription factor [Acidobacteriota bacterium]